MKKKIILVLALVLSIFFVNYKDINSLAVISNIGIEKNNNKYHIIFQEVIPKQIEGKTTKSYKYYEVNSNSLDIALKKINKLLTKQVYLTHLETLVLNINSTDIIPKLKDYFKYKDNFKIVLTDSKINKILKYKNNYKYINTLINKDIKFKYLDNSKIPFISIRKNNLKVVDYIKLNY